MRISTTELTRKKGIEVILLENEIISIAPPSSLRRYGDAPERGWRRLVFELKGINWTIEFDAYGGLRGRLPREYMGRLRRILGIDPEGSFYRLENDETEFL